MRKSEATNTFNDGLIMDINPIVTPNNALVNCLNGTLITYNGNEYVLQNDMGNGRVETASLPQGYIPVGITEFGGIIYVISYNPLSDKCQIGSFPSPERNIASDEISQLQQSLSYLAFQDEQVSGNIKTALVKIKLIDKPLHPGDQFLVYTTQNKLQENKDKISDYGATKVDELPKTVKLSLVAIDENNKITYLDDSLKWFKFNQTSQEGYFIPELSEQESIPNLDQYRTLTESGYNVFTSKVSGELYLIAQLESIDSFNIENQIELFSEYLVKIPDISSSTKSIPNITADQKTIQDIGKEQSLQLSVKANWTSKNLQYINPKYLILTESRCSGSCSTSITKGWGVEITNDLQKEHREEGSLSIVLGYIDFDKSNNPFYTYKIMPAMSYGKLPLYEISKTIDLNKYGTGEIELTEWRYTADLTNKELYLSWGLSTYLKEEESISAVEFVFIPYNDEAQIVANITGKTSYDGSFTEKIQLSDTTYEVPPEGSPSIDTVTLKPNYLYLVGIKVDIKHGQTDNTSKIMFTRWLYTNGVFNNLYEQDIVDYDSQRVQLELFQELKTGNEYVTSGGSEDEWGVVDSKNTESNYCSRNALEDYQCRATIKHHIDRECLCTINSKLSNNYNTFNIDTSKIQHTVTVGNSDIGIEVQYYKNDILTDINNISPNIYKYIKPEINKGQDINSNWAVPGKRIWEDPKAAFDITLTSEITSRVENTFTLRWKGECYQNIYLQQGQQDKATIMASLVYNTAEALKFKLSDTGENWKIVGNIPGGLVGGNSSYFEGNKVFSCTATIADSRTNSIPNFDTDGQPQTYSQIENIEQFIRDCNFGSDDDQTVCYPFIIDYDVSDRNRWRKHVVSTKTLNSKYQCYARYSDIVNNENAYSKEPDLTTYPRVLMLAVRGGDDKWYLYNFAIPLSNNQVIRDKSIFVGNILFYYFSNFYKIYNSDVTYFKPIYYIYPKYDINYKPQVRIQSQYLEAPTFMGITLSQEFLNKKLDQLRTLYSDYKYQYSKNNNLNINVITYDTYNTVSRTIEVKSSPNSESSDWYSTRYNGSPVICFISNGTVKYLYTPYQDDKIYGYDGQQFSEDTMVLTYSLDPESTYGKNKEYGYYYIKGDNLKSIKNYTNPLILNGTKINLSNYKLANNEIYITQHYNTPGPYYNAYLFNCVVETQLVPELAPIKTYD